MTQEFVDLEIHLEKDRIRLHGSDQEDVVGPVLLDENLLQNLLELEIGGELGVYGKRLFDTLFPAGLDVSRALYSSFDHARKSSKRLRLRLSLDVGIQLKVQCLHWELLTDGQDIVIGRSTEIAFSRYVPLLAPVHPPPKKPRLLCVIAAPKDSHRFQLAPIHYDLVRQQLEKTLQNVAEKIQVHMLDRPVTPERVREALITGKFDLLHFHGHGIAGRNEEAALVLESEDNTAVLVKESTLGEISRGLRNLKLVTLVACHSGVRTSENDGLSGLSGRLVRSNVPAVIAMRRTISMDLGLRFANRLYSQLAEDPCIDAAVNEARHQLFLDQPDSADWSSPILTMRLRNGLLWELPLNQEPRDPDAKPERQMGKRGQALAGLLTLSLAASLTPWGLWLNAGPVRDNWANHSPETVLTSIEPGRLAVGVVSSTGFSWNESASRSMVRWARASLEERQIVPVPEGLRSQIDRIVNGDLSAFPGGDTSPGGVEYLMLLLEKHGPKADNREPFPVVSLTCETVLLKTSKPAVIYEHSGGHLGMAPSEKGALEQAFGRCFEDISGGLDVIR